MPNPFDFNEILSIQASGRPLDAFGPKTNFPFLAFDLTGSDERLNNWLKKSPIALLRSCSAWRMISNSL